MAGQDMETRIAGLLQQMTLQEKIGQLVMLTGDMAVTGPGVTQDAIQRVRHGDAGSILNLWGPERARAMQKIAVEETRLGIPLLFGFDAVHGHRTIFPVPLAEACAFDPDLWRRTAESAGREAAADGVHLTFAPMLDVCRDLRWGRIVEGPGEDPHVAERMARAKVEGFQAARIGATAKHFVGYGASDAGRDYAAVDLSDRALEEIHLPGFKAAVEAGVMAVMPAFTDIAGIPLTAHEGLIAKKLRGTWGFDGLVVSDYTAVDELIPHGVAADQAEAAALALKAGVDIDMVGTAYAKGLPIALQRGLVDTSLIEAATLRVLRLKARLGLLDDPYRGLGDEGAKPSADSRALARDAARRSIVLLSDPRRILPLDPAPGRIAVIGPNADSAAEVLGPWAGDGKLDEAVTLLQGLRTAFNGADLVHVPGTATALAVAAAEAADIAILCVGETRGQSGEAASRARPDLPEDQTRLARAVLDSGKPVVVLLSSGRPVTAPWLFERAAVLAIWFPGTEGGNAVADVLTGRWSPSARLAVSWPWDVGQAPITYAERPTGRPFAAANHYTSKYLDVPNSPQFPFGHGLSYTRFTYGPPKVDRTTLRAGETVTVEVEVANSGQRAAETKLFLFSRDPVASVSRPVLELRRFERVALGPGAGTTVRFTLPAETFAFLGRDLAPVLEPGEIRLFSGPSADPATLEEVRITIDA